MGFWGFMESLESMMSFIRLRKFTAINSSSIAYAPQVSCWMANMDLKLNIFKKKTYGFLSKTYYSPNLPQPSQEHHFYTTTQDKNLIMLLNSSFSSNLPPPLESTNTHLSKHILNLPSLPQLPAITHLILDFVKSLLTGLSVVHCPHITKVVFLEHESGHILLPCLPDSPHVLSPYNLSHGLPRQTPISF